MEHISEEINHIIESHVVFTIKILGLSIEIRDSILVMWVLMIAIYIFSKILTTKLKEIPDGKQNFAETIVEKVNDFVKENGNKEHYFIIAPYIGTILLFISFSNMAAIFNIIPNPKEIYEITGWNFLAKWPEIRIFPPTKDINVTFALAIVSVGMVFYKTIQVKKVKGALKSLIEPVPLMLPFNLLDYAVRPVSLTLRMFGNVMAAFIMMELIYLMMPLILPGFLSLYFDLFDGILQAFIFTFLTTLYMSEALE